MPAIASGVAAMTAGVALLTVNDAVMKWSVATMPIGEAVFVRGIFVMALCCAWIGRRHGASGFRLRAPAANLLRGLLTLVNTFLFLTSLRYLPLADAVAITFASPIFVALLAPALLQERVDGRHLLAVTGGFVGVLVILQPGSGSFRWVALLPLAVALIEAFRDLLTRRVVTMDGTWAMVLATVTVVNIGALMTAPFGWRAIGIDEVCLLAGSALLFTGAQLCLTESFRFAPASVVAPFRYSSVIWAGGVDLVIWRIWPSVWTALGCVLIVASGLFLLHLQLSRPHEPEAP